MCALKYFLKVFAIALACFLLAVGAGVYTYSKIYVPSEEEPEITDNEKDNEKNDEDSTKEEEPKDPLQKAIAKSKRVNFLLMGMEGARSDTLILQAMILKQKRWT